VLRNAAMVQADGLSVCCERVRLNGSVGVVVPLRNLFFVGRHPWGKSEASVEFIGHRV
jgi:hypothetical protein